MKRKVATDWGLAFPDLTKVGERRLLRIVGPLLVGVEIVTGPDDLYRPYSVAYPLWREDPKGCLDYPEVLYECVNERGEQMFIPYSKHELRLQETISRVMQDALFPVSGDISLSNLLKGIHKYEESNFVKAQGVVARARMLRFRCLCSLFVNRMDLVGSTLDTIQSEKTQWDMTRFVAMFGDFDSWFGGIIDIIESENGLHQAVENNLKTPKFGKLTRAELTSQ